MNTTPEVRERKPENENSKETMPPAEQESEPEKIIQKDNTSLFNIIQAARMKRQEAKNKQNYEDFINIADSLMINKEKKMECENFNKSFLSEEPD